MNICIGSSVHPLIPRRDLLRTASRNILYDGDSRKLILALEDKPLVVLLLSLLPNIRELHVYDIPCFLIWRNSYPFKNMKRLTVRAGDGESDSALGFLNEVLQGGRLETFRYTLLAESITTRG
jgi:hypothetical protein